MPTKHLLTLLLFIFTVPLVGQIDLDYQIPHKDIYSLADAKQPPRIRINTKGTQALLLSRHSYKSIEEMSEEELRLGGLRINPKTNISSRARYYYDVKILDVKSGKESKILGLPQNGKFTNLSWSPDEKMVSLTHTTSNGVGLWVVDMMTHEAKPITDDNLNANMGNPSIWMKDGKSFLVKVLPSDRQPLINPLLAVPEGPTISENAAGLKAQNRTYQDLLKDGNDEFNFEQLSRSEIWKYDLDGKGTLWKAAGMHRGINQSPDGKYFIVSEIERPFSYLVPYYRFPTEYNIYRSNGQLERKLYESPLIEDLPKGFMSVKTGMRSITWRGDKPSTIVFAEALDEGDPSLEVEYRDAIYTLEAPFNGKPKMMAKTKLRYSGVQWGSDQIAVLSEYWWNTRMERVSIINPSDVNQEAVIFSDRNYQDRYSDPGSFVTKKNSLGRYTLNILKDDQLLLIGRGYSPEGIYPFVDRYDISSGETTRDYHASDKTKLENILQVVDAEKGIILSTLQSKSEYPNFYFRNMHSGALQPITHNKNPFEAIQNVHKEVITYKREDGLELSATLYLPVGYDMAKKEKKPMLMWAYPREYKDKNSASQITSSENEFTYPYYGSPIYWVNRGYVVLDDTAFPIIGEGDQEPNDTFIPQLVANAKAAIDAVDELGYIDRKRVAVGGHSYGAFMTANLLTHSNLFAAGIARSGAYNRTLTPFGFQAEERSYWEAPEIYYQMSPFMHCDKMKTPLLLIHGQEDNNSGTYPMQSERYFNALKGLGAPVRLVMLPKESHGYAARESIMHMLYEQDEWLEKHLKNKEIKP